VFRRLEEEHGFPWRKACWLDDFRSVGGRERVPGEEERECRRDIRATKFATQ